MNDQLRGILPPMVTPFDHNEEVDTRALAADVDFLLDAGVQGVTVGGSTGAGHTLSTDEVRLVAGTAIEAAAGRGSVIAGVVTDSTRQAAARAEPLVPWQDTPWQGSRRNTRIL